MAKTTTTNPVPISADVLQRAADDLTALGEVFGWLNAMLGSIADAAKKDDCTLGSRLIRIGELAGCGRYLAGDWENMAENMADAARAGLNAQTEAGHGK